VGLRASQSYVMERDLNIATDLLNRWPPVKTKSFCMVTISGNTLALELAGSRRQLRLQKMKRGKSLVSLFSSTRGVSEFHSTNAKEKPYRCLASSDVSDTFHLGWCPSCMLRVVRSTMEQCLRILPIRSFTKQD